MLSVGFRKISSPAVISSFQNIGKRYFRQSLKCNAENPRIVELREKEKQVQRLQAFRFANKSLPSFQEYLDKNNEEFKRTSLKTLQINVGKLCNLTCHHCHVESGPTKTRENMSFDTVQRVIHLMKNSKEIETIDITGGAPEMNPHFKYLIENSRALRYNILDRCNLTVFYEKGMQDLPQFLKDNEVQIVASMPCYTLANVDKQRGNGVFEKSISALKWLNSLGYGKDDTNLQLHLVYNPVGAYLPGSQQGLENDYKRELKQQFNIEFNKLYTITNMPIKRFADTLLNSGEYTKYMELLVNNYNSATLSEVMCRNLISISWDGKIYDCDFNQMLDMPAAATKKGIENLTIWDVNSVDEFINQPIAVDSHCFGCTAGAGSSCTGALK